MLKRLFILYMLVAIAGSVTAAVTDSINVKEHLSEWNRSAVFLTGNPAFRCSDFATSLSQLGYTFSYEKQQEAYVMQIGDGSAMSTIGVDSYKHLRSNQTVWGVASYTTGSRKGVKWNSTADYELLYPYVLADSIGGDLDAERYLFSGGYATSFTNGISVGVELAYRAEHEFRKRDPRPRNVVSDLKILAGAKYDISGYSFGASVGIDIYKQTGSVEFYNEAGVVSEYQMTGLGAIYSRFSGDVTSLYHKGSGWNVELSATPLFRNGWLLVVNADRINYQRIASSTNSLPLTTLFVTSVGVETGFRVSSFTDWSITLRADYTLREGIEHVAGNASSSVYPILGDLKMYSNSRKDIFLKGLVGMSKCSWGEWHAFAKMGYLAQEAEYIYPKRSIDIEKMYGGVGVQVIYSSLKNTLFTWKASGYYYANVSASKDLPMADMIPSFRNMMSYSFRYYSADYTVLSTVLRTDYRQQKSSIGFYAEAGGGYTICSTGKNAVSFSMSAGVTF